MKKANAKLRPDGRWEARYVKGYELSGKIKYGFCYGKTYREAKEKVLKQKAALVTGQTMASNYSKHRFGYYCDEWLASVRRNLNSPVSIGLPVRVLVPPMVAEVVPVTV